MSKDSEKIIEPKIGLLPVQIHIIKYFHMRTYAHCIPKVHTFSNPELQSIPHEQLMIIVPLSTLGNMGKSFAGKHLVIGEKEKA